MSYQTTPLNKAALAKVVTLVVLTAVGFFGLLLWLTGCSTGNSQPEDPAPSPARPARLMSVTAWGMNQSDFWTQASMPIQTGSNIWTFTNFYSYPYTVVTVIHPVTIVVQERVL